MGDFANVVRNRRMTRAFQPTPLDRPLLAHLVDLASRAPSAGKTQGWHLVILEGEETGAFWDCTLPPARRQTFRWQGLLSAPVIALPLADADAYTARYSEPDKAQTGLGESSDAWPVPYWTVDTSMAVMTLLLAAQDSGLGALFFGIFKGEAEVRERFGIPESMELLGALAIGYPAGDDREGHSARRIRRAAGDIIRWGRW